MPELAWKRDGYGRENFALYLGGIYVGGLMDGPPSYHPGEVRAWVMHDDEGREVGWYPNHDTARAALVAEVGKLLAEGDEPTLPCEVIVGAVRFNTGVKISTVLNAIQRHRLRQASGPLKQ